MINSNARRTIKRLRTAQIGGESCDIAQILFVIKDAFDGFGWRIGSQFPRVTLGNSSRGWWGEVLQRLYEERVIDHKTIFHPEGYSVSFWSLTDLGYEIIDHFERHPPQPVSESKRRWWRFWS